MNIPVIALLGIYVVSLATIFWREASNIFKNHHLTFNYFLKIHKKSTTTTTESTLAASTTTIAGLPTTTKTTTVITDHSSQDLDNKMKTPTKKKDDK